MEILGPKKRGHVEGKEDVWLPEICYIKETWKIRMYSRPAILTSYFLCATVQDTGVGKVYAN